MAVSPIVDPILHVLVWFYQVFDNNLGFAIIAFTVLFRSILLPLSVPALKSQKKIQSLKPHLSKLKEQYGHDKQLMQQKQMELYKEHNINPLSGCLPYLLQFGILIVLYNALNHVLNTSEVFGVAIQTKFFGLDLVKPDQTWILPILSGVTQLILSLMVLPGVEHHDVISDTSKNPKAIEANKKENDVQEMAESVQKQMVLMMPVMTGVIAVSFPSGLAMYWVITTVYSIVQQYAFSGWGGLEYYWKKTLQFVTGKKTAVFMGPKPVLENQILKEVKKKEDLSPLAKALSGQKSVKKAEKKKRKNKSHR